MVKNIVKAYFPSTIGMLMLAVALTHKRAPHQRRWNTELERLNTENIMFLMADDNVIYHTSSIDRYWIDGNQVIAQLKEGGRVKFPASCDIRIRRAHFTSIPASPGTFYIGIVEEVGVPTSIWLKPVIAWLVGNGGPPVPVTTDGEEDDVTNEYAILHPTGRVSRWEQPDTNGLGRFLEQLNLDDAAIDDAITDARAAGAMLR